jgi:hypothetical protein
MSSADVPNFKAALADLSNFPSVADRSQQGFVDFMFLGRLLTHPLGAASDAAFRTIAGQPLIRTGELYYDGNSQGAIMGGALTALEPDLQRAVLGVPAMNWSLLLDRSVDWYGQFNDLYRASYTDPIDQEVGLGLLQMLWDRAESDGYVEHMTANPLPDTAPHQVLLQVAFGDHQVSNIASEVEGRSIGALLREPALPAGLHWSVNPRFGFDTISQFPASGGSYFVYWYDPTANDAAPPLVNFPDVAGKDPHDYPRRDRNAGAQESEFLLTGKLTDPCHGPCLTTPSGRIG